MAKSVSKPKKQAKKSKKKVKNPVIGHTMSKKMAKPWNKGEEPRHRARFVVRHGGSSPACGDACS